MGKIKNSKYLSKALSVGMALALACNMLPMQNLRAEEAVKTEGQEEAEGKTESKKAGQESTEEKNGGERAEREKTEGEKGTQEGQENGQEGEEPVEEDIVQEVIEIHTVGEFQAFADKCFIDSWSANKEVLLCEDLDLSGVEFGAIPVFAGHFDGQGHTISGFEYSGDGYVAGLFRYIEKGAMVENLKLVGEIIATDEKECIGGLCGVNYGTIKRCIFQGTVSGKSTVGGLVGVNEGTGVVLNSFSGGRVTGYYGTGGMAGKNHGLMSYCTNRACVNNDNEWVEEDDEMGMGLFLSINITGSETEIFSGVDTGGIAGFSDGTIIRCMNYGQIGYEHTGYNIGGIAGRQSGVVSSCTNNGTVYGRKDVGGIVGQMEPYIEVDEAESLRNAVNKLHDLIEKTIDDMQAGKNVIKGDLDQLAAYSDGVTDAGDALAGQMTDFVDENMDQVQSMADRLRHVMEMLPDIFDDVYDAEDSFADAGRTLSLVVDELQNVGGISGEYVETDYNRLTLLSTVGGNILSMQHYPEAGEKVNIVAEPNDGYGLQNLRVVDAAGNSVEIQKESERSYTFTMPGPNVRVEAYFGYQGEEGSEGEDMAGGDGMEEAPEEGNGADKDGIGIGNENGILDGNGENDGDGIGTGTSGNGAGNGTNAPDNGTEDAGTSDGKPSAGTDASGGSVNDTGISGSEGENGAGASGSEGGNGAGASGSEGGNGEGTSDSTGGNAAGTSGSEGGDSTDTSGSAAGNGMDGAPENGNGNGDGNGNGNGGNTSKEPGNESGNTAGSGNSAGEAASGDGAGASGNHGENGPDESGSQPENASGQSGSPSGNSGEAGGTDGSAQDQPSARRQKIQANHFEYTPAQFLSADIHVPEIKMLASLAGMQEPGAEPEGSGEAAERRSGMAKTVICLSSNLSGNAFGRINGDTATVTVIPDGGYAIDGMPSVSVGGREIPVSQEGEYAYTFPVSGGTYQVYISFRKLDKSQTVSSAKGDISNAIRKQQEATEKVNAIIQGIQSGSSVTEEQLEELTKALGEMSDATAAVLSNLGVVSNVVGQDVLGRIEAAGSNMSAALEHLQDAVDSVKSATRDARSIVDYVNGQQSLHFSKLGSEFDGNRENLHNQLKGMSDSILSLSGNASAYSDVVNDDLRAVNDQINIVFNLLADNLTNYGEISVEELYEDADIEDVDSITTGKTNHCTNRGVIEGDINVGGIAGAMSIDEEDPEDSAAGTVDYQIGRRYFTKCVITGSVNEGYVTAKKDGAGGIVGYMRHGIVVDSEGYGSVESTEGDYAGGICGESLTVIKNCFALCSVSGGKNVGGIAGFASTIKDCYAMVDCNATMGRKGAIAGQTEDYEDALSGKEAEEAKVSGNYYVGDDTYGIDDISYVGVAEPIKYEELLAVAGLPTQFRHLKVIYRVDNLYLGEQEVKFGESLSQLDYPVIPAKEGYYGVWPDYSDRVMAGNLLVKGEYKEDVTVVESSGKLAMEAEGGREKPYALVEQRFTEDTVLHADLSSMEPPEKAAHMENVIYKVVLENAKIGSGDTFAIRLYNPYKDAEVWGYKDGTWAELESKARGQYLQVDMTGPEQAFCIIEHQSRIWVVVSGAAAGLAAAGLLLILVRKLKKVGRKKKVPEE